MGREPVGVGRGGTGRPALGVGRAVGVGLAGLAAGSAESGVLPIVASGAGVAALSAAVSGWGGSESGGLLGAAEVGIEEVRVVRKGKPPPA